MNTYGIDLNEMLKQAEANGRTQVAEVIKNELAKNDEVRLNKLAGVFASMYDLGFTDLTDVEIEYLKERLEK